jgi:putative hydrolase of the HAD superfamily
LGYPQAVTFDVGNTLIYPHPSVPSVVREVLVEAGHIRDLERIDALMPLVDAFYEDRYRADDTFWTNEEETSEVWVGMYALLCRELDIHEQAEVLARRVYDRFGEARRWRAWPDVVPCLDRLRSAGVVTAIVSNWDQRLEGLLAGLDIGGRVDTVVCSAAVGLHKPDPRIFELACERLGADPKRSAHVGDHYYSDFVGATAVGMRAVLIDRHDSGMRSGTAPLIGTLDDLEAALGA